MRRQLQSGGYGLVCGAYPMHEVGGSGNSQEGSACLVWEVMVKGYGVAMTMPQGYSRVPDPSIECQ
jgi:hypothetical protein